MSVRVSVITVNFNHKYFPKVQVEALEKSREYMRRHASEERHAGHGERGACIDLKIVYVDNASTDPISVGFLEHANREGRLKLVRSTKNLGFAGGNNLGAANISSEANERHVDAASAGGDEYIFILNPDTAVHVDAIEKMVRYLEAHRDVGILGPKLVYPDGTVQESCRRDMGFLDLIIKRTFLRCVPGLQRRVDRYLMHDFDHHKTQEVELITGAAMMLPRRVFEEIGGFDERYFLFMEDFDVCKKVRAAGYTVVYFPEAVIDHYHKRLSDGNVFGLLLKKVFWIHVASAAKYFWKWRGS